MTYSKEEDTPSYDMIDDVDPQEKDRRLNEMMELQTSLQNDINEHLVGQTLEVLVEKYDGFTKMYHARSIYSAPDGVDGEEIFADQTTIVPSGEDTPRFDETTISRPDYKFAGWDQPVTDKVTQRVVYTALWEKVEAPKKPTPTPEGPGDDGGPFTKDECGNVFDRWGNKIYEAKGCNVKGYKLVQTSVID